MTRRALLDARARRSGLAAIWVIVLLPALFLMLVMVLEVGNLWVAQAELTHAAEAGALAGANLWGDLGADTAAARQAARQAAAAFVEANTIVGHSPKGGQSSTTIRLGRIEGAAFYPAEQSSTSIPPSNRACRVHVTLALPGLFSRVAGPFTVQASAAARYHPETQTPRLVHLSHP